MTIEINGKGFPTSDTMYWYFLSFPGENKFWTIFFCINLVIMLVIMYYAICISHYASLGTHFKLSSSDSLWVEPLMYRLAQVVKY